MDQPKRTRIPLFPVFLVAFGLVGALPSKAQLMDLQVDALDPQACGGAGCWTNHLRVVDLDGDGDLDLVLVNYADFFGGNNSPQPLVIYQNDGQAGFSNVSATAVGGFTGNLRQIAIGDVDGDGSPDLYCPDATGGPHALFMNDGSGVFTNEAAARLPTSYPAGAAARMGDVDNDGDLDLFVSDAYAEAGPPFGHLYLNDGTGVFTELSGAIPTTISGEDLCDVELLDVDGDLDLDLFVNAHAGGTGALWLNDGTGVFSAGGTVPPPATTNFHYNVTPCDVDGDGDLDLWIDNIGGGFTEQLLINDGAGNFTDETSTRVTGNPGADDNGVLCVDIDHDGDMDAVVLALGTAERLLENDGTGHFTYVVGAFPPPTDCTLWGELGDLDGDDRLDLVTGQGECSSSDEVYLGNATLAVDDLAPTIYRVETLGTVAVGASPTVRFAVRDSHHTDQGPRLGRAYAEIDPTGTPTEIDAFAMGGELFRVVLPPANAAITFRVCAIDPSGNQACSPTQTYGEDPPPPVDAGVDSGVESDASTDASTDAEVSGDAAPEPDASALDPDASGPAPDAGPGDPRGSGCSCESAGGSTPFGGPLILCAMLLLFLRRRKA